MNTILKDIKHSRVTLHPSGECELRIAQSEKKYKGRMIDAANFSTEIAQTEKCILTGRFRHFEKDSVVFLSRGKTFVASVSSEGYIKKRGEK